MIKKWKLKLLFEDGKCVNYEYPIKNEQSESPQIILNDQSIILNDSIITNLLQFKQIFIIKSMNKLFREFN